MTVYKVSRVRDSGRSTADGMRGPSLPPAVPEAVRDVENNDLGSGGLWVWSTQKMARNAHTRPERTARPARVPHAVSPAATAGTISEGRCLFLRNVRRKETPQHRGYGVRGGRVACVLREQNARTRNPVTRRPVFGGGGDQNDTKSLLGQLPWSPLECALTYPQMLTQCLPKEKPAI